MTHEDHKRLSNRSYDKYKRNKEAKVFYKCKAWEKARLQALERDHYLCQPCYRDKQKITPANIVHHTEALEDRPDLALTLENLEVICSGCHNKEHPEKGSGKKEKPKPTKLKIISSKANEERC